MASGHILHVVCHSVVCLVLSDVDAMMGGEVQIDEWNRIRTFPIELLPFRSCVSAVL